MAAEIDLHLGRRLRRRRRLLGLTQQQLGDRVGVRFQQIQKYECGANRLSAARLWELAEALETLAPRRRKLDDALYGEAYRRVGEGPQRERQIALIGRVGRGFGKALQMPGVAALLAFSRGPARLAGLGELQGFLERGYAAFESLDDAAAFVDEIERDEREVSRRLFAGDDAPFVFG